MLHQVASAIVRPEFATIIKSEIKSNCKQQCLIIYRARLALITRREKDTRQVRLQYCTSSCMQNEANNCDSSGQEEQESTKFVKKQKIATKDKGKKEHLCIGRNSNLNGQRSIHL